MTDRACESRSCLAGRQESCSSRRVEVGRFSGPMRAGTKTSATAPQTPVHKLIPNASSNQSDFVL